MASGRRYADDKIPCSVNALFSKKSIHLLISRIGESKFLGDIVIDDAERLKTAQSLTRSIDTYSIWKQRHESPKHLVLPCLKWRRTTHDSRCDDARHARDKRRRHVFERRPGDEHRVNALASKRRDIC